MECLPIVNLMLLAQEDFERVMSGIVCDTVSAVRDEAPQAYKDLSVVMANQVCKPQAVLPPLVYQRREATQGLKYAGKPSGHRTPSEAAHQCKGH